MLESCVRVLHPLKQQYHQCLSDCKCLSGSCLLDNGSHEDEPAPNIHGERNHFPQREVGDQDSPEWFQDRNEPGFQGIKETVREVRQHDGQERAGKRDIQHDWQVMGKYRMEAVPVSKEQRKQRHPERKAQMFDA